MLLLLSFALAADPTETTVDGVKITKAEVDAAAASIPTYQEDMRPMLIDRMVEIQLLNAEASRRKLGKSKADKLRLAMAQKEVMATLAVEAYVAEAATDTAIKAWYDANLARYSRAEGQAHHILVKEEAEATALLDRVKAGEDFEKLAAEKSLDPSAAANKGDLGWFERERMVGPFAAAVFDNPVGTLTMVETQFGWHVVRVDGRRDAVPLEEVRDDIKLEMRESLLEAWLGELRAKAKVVPAAP